MAEIVSYGSSTPSGVNSKKGIIKKTFDWYKASDKSIKFAVLTLLLIAAATPFIVNQLQTYTQHADVQGLVKLINDQRASKNLTPLAEDQALISGACWKTSDMAVNNYFSHADLSGNYTWPKLREFGVGNESLGEILGLNAYSSSDIFNAWKAGPSYAAIMEDPKYTRIGVGRTLGSDGKLYWAAEFASGIPILVSDWKCNDIPIQQPDNPPAPEFAPPAAATTAPTQAPVLIIDTDGDGFNDVLEVYLGTSVNVKCPTDSSPGTPNGYWPADLTGDNKVDKTDAESFSPYFGKRTGDNGFNSRFDLNKNGIINGQDVLTLNKYMNTSCQ